MRERHAITLTDLPIELAVGVPEAERARPQRLLVSLRLELTAGPAFHERDALLETLDYAALIAFLREGLPALGPFQLIETVADRIAAHALAASALVESAEATVAKPSVLGEAGGLVAVSIARTQAARRAPWAKAS